MANAPTPAIKAVGVQVNAEISRRVRALRLRFGLSQQALADALGVNVNWVCVIEQNRRRLLFFEAALLSRFFHVDLGHLMPTSLLEEAFLALSGPSSQEATADSEAA